MQLLQAMLVAAITVELEVESHYGEFLSEGGNRRVSLSYWAKYVSGRKNLLLQQFLASLIENFLLSQHFGIAAIRTSETKPRLRITIEEEGLVSLLKTENDVWKPGLTPDRLASTLSLMAECDLADSEWSDSLEDMVYSSCRSKNLTTP